MENSKSGGALNSRLRCGEEVRLFSSMKRSIRAMVGVQVKHVEFLREGRQISGFEDTLVITANKWKAAQQAYAQHVREHGC